MRRLVITSLLALASVAAQAQTFTLPVTIGGSGNAKAADVGADFKAVADAINSLNVRVSKLEGNIVMADLAGTYTLSALQAEIGGANSTSPHVSAYTYLGSMTLTADGNGTFTNTQTGTSLNLGTGLVAPVNGTGGTGFTWTYANGVFSALGGNFVVTAGGRLIIRASSNPSDGTSNLLLLSRLQ